METDEYRAIQAEFALREIESSTKQKDYALLELLNKENPKYQSIGMGINEGTFYIGIRLFEDGKYYDAVICSDKSVYINRKGSDEIKDKFKLNYRFPLYQDVVDYFWSNTGKYGIRAWLYENANVSIKEAYENVLKMIKWKYWNPDENLYKHHALSIISGYFLPVFEMKGRELVYGESGWGKTRLSKIYQLLAFNSVMSADFSDASIFRIIESVKPTIIIDNFDSLDDEKKKRILHIFNTGCYKKQKTIRAEGRTFRPTGFDSYSNLLLNSIISLGEVEENRSNITRNLKTDKPEYNKLEDAKPIWSETRDKLHICVLQRYQDVQKAYEELKEDRLISRELERVAPNLTIARLISDEFYDEMLNFYIKGNARRKIKEFKDDWVYLATEMIIEKLAQNPQLNEIELKVKDVVGEIAGKIFDAQSKEYDRKKHGLSIVLGSAFKNCVLFPVRILDGYPTYKFTKESILQFCNLKDFGDDIKQPLHSLHTLQPLHSLHSLNSPQTSGISESSESKGQEVTIATCSICGVRDVSCRLNSKGDRACDSCWSSQP